MISPWNPLAKNTGVGCHSLLHGIFLTQGLNRGLLHWRQILYHLSHLEGPGKQNSSYVCWKLSPVFGKVTQGRQFRKEWAGLRKKRKENEESLESQSLARLKKIPIISIPPPKQKIQLEKPLRQDSLVKPFIQISFLQA